MKRGQEELVGFVAVMLLLAVVFMVFLALSLRTPTTDVRENSDVRSFLSSSMEVTTSCATGYERNLLRVKDLIRACQKGEVCLTGASTCTLVNTTLVTLIDQAFKPGSESKTIGYSLTGYYLSNLSSETPPTSLFEAGNSNCTGRLRGSSYTVPASPGGVVVTLRLCATAGT